MPTSTERLHEMHALSARMLEAARADRWEEFIELEQKAAELRDQLVVAGNDALDRATADIETLARQTTLIQQTLANHDETHRHVQPRLDEIRHLLGDTASKRRVDMAYGIDEV